MNETLYGFELTNKEELDLRLLLSERSMVNFDHMFISELEFSNWLYERRYKQLEKLLC